jgi:hypothetical protein
MSKPDRKMAREALYEAIENQMREDNPQETKATFHSLLAAGYSRKETTRLLTCVLLVELNNMIRDYRFYKEASYVEKLKALPRLPWEEEPEECA